jgi:hypothetical protein
MSKSNPQTLDPIAKAPGAHPAIAGTVVGAIAGGVADHDIADDANRTGRTRAGAVTGSAGRGTGTAKVVDADDEERYWSAAYQHRPYYDSTLNYDDYRPAYELGYRMRAASDGTFDQSERRLSQDWAMVKGESRLTWEQVKQAARDAWDRATD